LYNNSRKLQFEPELPEDKKTSIRKLGFGLLNKLILFFPKVFWDAELDYIGELYEKHMI
jgi:monoamine oxidase